MFSIASGIILYVVIKNRTNKKIATWALVLFTVCFYNILGSLQPDVDGAIIPFLFLLSVYFYDKLNLSHGPEKGKWFTLLMISLLIGFLIKLNFILVIGALILDYLWSNWKQIQAKQLGFGAVGVVGFGLLYIALLYIIQAIYPAFSIASMLGHANQYTGVGRNWIQIVVQGMKTIFYLSPLFLVPLLFTSKEIFNKVRIFSIYLVMSLIFYFVMFDFSRGALDKYVMFAIVPLAAICGMIFAKIFESSKKQTNRFLDHVVENKWSLLVGIVLAVLLFVANFLPQTVIALYPKTEWFARVFHGEWNMLNPFNGGSGPMGFYVSFLFIAASFLASVVVAIIGIFKKEWRYSITIILISIGLMYNFIFAEELFFGKINGSAPQVLSEAINYIAKSNSIKKVMTYNDIGNQYLSPIRKYAGRIYATPESEAGYKKRFREFDGQYLVIDIPHIYEQSFYGKFFAHCNILFETSSGKIIGRVYDCPNNQKWIDSI